MITQTDTDQMRACAYNGTPYRATVELSLRQILAAVAATGETDIEPLLSIHATGFPSMTDVSYRIVDFKGDDAGTLIIDVSGRVKDVVDEMNAAQVQDA